MRPPASHGRAQPPADGAELGTVVYALRRHPLNLVGRDVAVIGQGSAGAFFTFLLKRAGVARVLVSDKSPARLAYGRQLGADLAVDAGSTDFRAAVLEETGGRGATWSWRRSAAGRRSR